MQDIIHLLPDSVANQIAAGEVVQRPASIVKELVENSIDAGASSIQVLITDGGRTCVQVIDDGVGMSETDARLAFERHATSKITSADDLFTLTTMGFRGEALASIAAVAQVELRTRRAEDELGVFLSLAGSKVEKQEPVACPVGSNFAVRNLFFNVPARRKFLKSNQTELSNIITDFERIVLTHPDIAFSLSNNGTEIYNLPAAKLRQRILDVIGKKHDPDLVALETETTLVSISGYVGQPQAARKRGQHQFFFVNGRFMNHPFFRSAVVRAYENLIPAGEQPSFFLYLAVNPSSIDVNVHPTKTEIKFDYEQDIWKIIHAAVKEALGKYANTPSIDFDTEGRPDIPAMESRMNYLPKQPSVKVDKNYNPFNLTGHTIAQPHASSNWETLYPDVPSQSETPGPTHLWSGALDNPFDGDNPLDGMGGGGATMPDTGNAGNPLAPHGSSADSLTFAGKSAFADSSETEKTPELTSSTPFFQYKGRYVVIPDSNGLVLVDQHRAHICVLYDQYQHSLFKQPGASQGMLFPEVVTFSASEMVLLDTLMSDLEFIGFELANLGGGSYCINGIPSCIDSANPIKLLHDLLASAGETNISIRESVRNSIALTMAKTVAIPYGQVLSEEETRLLLAQLFLLPASRYTPDGQVVFTRISHSVIETSFKGHK